MEDHSIDVQVYEAAHTFGEAELGVNIALYAQRAFALISHKTEQSFLSEETFNMWESHAGYFTATMIGHESDAGKIVTRQPNATGMKNVHRAKFLNNLIQHILLDRAHFSSVWFLSLKATNPSPYP